jgi:hypothetical protein
MSTGSMPEIAVAELAMGRRTGDRMSGAPVMRRRRVMVYERPDANRRTASMSGGRG